MSLLRGTSAVLLANVSARDGTSNPFTINPFQTIKQTTNVIDKSHSISPPMGKTFCWWGIQTEIHPQQKGNERKT